MPKKKKVTVKNEELFNKIASEIESAKNNTDTWAEKHDKFYRLRFRVKKTKTFPFTGCSNLRLPTIETYMRKTKAALIGIYSNIKPRMQVIPQTDQNLQKANKVERFLDFLVDHKIMLLEKLVLLCDKMLEKGFSLAKVTWSMKSRDYVEEFSLDDISGEDAQKLFSLEVPDEMIAQEFIKRFNVDMSETVMADNMQAVQEAVKEIRGGKEAIKIKLRDELYNAPDVYPCDPNSIYVPSDAGMNIQDLRWICHEYYESIEVIRERAQEGVYDTEAVDEIHDFRDLGTYDGTISKDNEKMIETTKDLREGIDRANNPSHLVKIWEIYRYYNPDEDKNKREHAPQQKWQFILCPEFHVILKKQILPYDHQKFPFVRFPTEIVDDRWFSPRGIPQHLEDLSKEIDAQHNQKIDNQTIRNAPMFKFRSGVVNPKLVRFIPAQGIPVSGMHPLDDSIKLMDNSNANVEFSYEREEMILKTTIQEYLGQVDYSLQSMINKRQPRTLGEVQMQAQNANQVFSLDVAIWTAGLSELFTQILELCQQYMPERVFAMVTGGDEPQPIQMTRDEIQGKYHIVCRGNDMNTNPYVKAQKSQMRVQLMVNPLTLQTGVVTPPNVYNIFKRYLQDDGEIAWKELITMPQPPQQQQPPPPGADIVPQFDELGEGEQAQVLVGRGIRPDIAGRAIEKETELNEAEEERKVKRQKAQSKPRASSKTT